MNVETIVAEIMAGTILLQDVNEAKSMLENEIAACDEVLQDPEMAEHNKAEFRPKRSRYVKALNRL